jgi:hypothetical protein
MPGANHILHGKKTKTSDQTNHTRITFGQFRLNAMHMGNEKREAQGLPALF